VALWTNAGPDLLLHEVSRSHTTTHHTRQGFSGRVIKPSQIPLPDNDQHLRKTSMFLAGFETRILKSDRPQTHALYRAATGIGTLLGRLCNQFYNMNDLLIGDRVWSVAIWWKVIKVHFFSVSRLEDVWRSGGIAPLSISALNGI
jgi:hypothetical protein